MFLFCSPRKRMVGHENVRQDILQRQYNMMKETKYTDFTVVTNDDFRFNIHRLCLSRSPYFAEMFDSQTMMGVNETREDVDKETFEVILQYLYTGETENDSDQVDKLIIFAQKYGISEMGEFYGYSLLKTLSVETAAHYLTLADKVPNEALKRKIISFIGMNLRDVIDSEGWAEATTNFNLMSELIEQSLLERRQGDMTYGTIATVMDGSNFEVTWTLRIEIEERQRIKRLDPEKHPKSIEFSSAEFFLHLNGKQTSWKLIAMPVFLEGEDEEPMHLYGYKAVIVYLAYTGCFRPPQILCKWKAEKPNGCCGKGEGSVQVAWEAVQNWFEDVTPIDLTGIIFVGDKIVLKVKFECSEDQGHPAIRSKEESAEYILANALRRKKNCDAKVIVDEYSFDVHKFVLCEQSQVFDEIFESVQTAYTLENIRPQVFDALLSLMYVTDDLSCDESVLGELLLAAHNYRLRDSLVQRCEGFLLENLLPSNAASFFVQAHVAGAETLKATALKLIGRCPEAVMASNGWLSLQTDPSLMTEVIEAIFKP